MKKKPIFTLFLCENDSLLLNVKKYIYINSSNVECKKIRKINDWRELTDAQLNWIFKVVFNNTNYEEKFITFQWFDNCFLDENREYTTRNLSIKKEINTIEIFYSRIHIDEAIFFIQGTFLYLNETLKFKQIKLELNDNKIKINNFYDINLIFKLISLSLCNNNFKIILPENFNLGMDLFLK